MEEFFARAWHEIVARPGGPMALRFYLQPLMATLFAFRDGIKDAYAGRPPYFWAVLSEPQHRSNLLREGWRSVGKIFILAFILDTIYQIVVLKGVRPLQGFLLAAVLAVVPYVLFRGPINRVVRTITHRKRSARI
jgi:hypothetical protein